MSRSGYPPWIMKRGGLESSGQRLISSIGKTNRIEFFSVGKKKLKKKIRKSDFFKRFFKIFWNFKFFYHFWRKKMIFGVFVDFCELFNFRGMKRLRLSLNLFIPLILVNILKSPTISSPTTPPYWSSLPGHPAWGVTDQGRLGAD